MHDGKQRFAVSRAKDAKFRPGFRTYFQDRDLGLREATSGRFMAEVHRACAPCPAEGSGLHLHKVELQFNYVLKGWFRVYFEGEGEFTFHAGDSWLQPPEIKHNVLGFSDDLEVLEIVSPGTFETQEA
ncbi:MAG TPA: cupin domain-containing protein [bacterium]|nr:cupin domain-containing protein [bacterium]